MHLTAATIELQDEQTQSARESLSVREFRTSNSTAFQIVKMKAYLKKTQRVEAHTVKQCARVSQRKFCKMKPAASLARTHMCEEKKNKL